VTRGPSEAGRNAAILAVGSSTGGTVAFEALAKGLPRAHPPLVLAQHLPADFVPRFAERLSQVLGSRVGVAKGGETLAPGEIWIAPGTHHLRVRSSGGRLVTELHDAPPVNHHKPSVDVLLESVARAAGPDAIGVMLTGMGSDGARGLLAMREAGAATIGQAADSCVVYGMPRAAKELGAVLQELPLSQIAGRIGQILGTRAVGAR
jgi:two-component system chemotaxis response regulator CheB